MGYLKFHIGSDNKNLSSSTPLVSTYCIIQQHFLNHSQKNPNNFPWKPPHLHRVCLVCRRLPAALFQGHSNKPPKYTSRVIPIIRFIFRSIASNRWVQSAKIILRANNGPTDVWRVELLEQLSTGTNHVFSVRGVQEPIRGGRLISALV